MKRILCSNPNSQLLLFQTRKGLMLCFWNVSVRIFTAVCSCRALWWLGKQVTKRKWVETHLGWVSIISGFSCILLKIIFPEGKRASYLQRHGLQEQHAEDLCNWGAEGEVDGETQQRRGGGQCSLKCDRHCHYTSLPHSGSIDTQAKGADGK